MKTLRATTPGPWGPTGSEFHVQELDDTEEHYVRNGTLVVVDTYAGMTSKERAVARAEALDLDTSGTEKDIEKRIAAHEAANPTLTE